jgi:protein-tyrosine phosphatase
MKGVESAQKIIQSGASVLVHCQQGRHRSVIMAAAILIANGHSAEQAITLLSTQRTSADPRAWYVRRQIHKFEKYWHAKTNSRE